VQRLLSRALTDAENVRQIVNVSDADYAKANKNIFSSSVSFDIYASCGLIDGGGRAEGGEALPPPRATREDTSRSGFM
jgi:hypothetical protein